METIKWRNSEEMHYKNEKVFNLEFCTKIFFDTTLLGEALQRA